MKALTTMIRPAAAARWSEVAACVGADTELFFPMDINSARSVAGVFCRSCPVVASCAALADDRREVGVWAGRFRKANYLPWKDLLL